MNLAGIIASSRGPVAAGAPPVLQAQGALAVNGFGSGDTTATLPTHAADDVLVASFLSINNGTATTDATCTTAGWTLIERFQRTSGSIILFDVSLWWKRATSDAEANPTFAFEAGWNTGNNTVRSARAYVIRGCATTGNPWDDTAIVGYATTDGALSALTVSGSNRLAIHFSAGTGETDNPTATGWTAGTGVASGTGYDSSAQTLRQDNVSSSTAGTTTSMASTGEYAYMGVAFKP